MVWLFKLAAVVAALAGFVVPTNAAKSENALRQRIQLSLESYLAQEVEGIQNCENKCDKAFNRMAYQISTAGTSTPTFEFTACVKGCTQCNADLATNNTANAGNCFNFCKNFDWKSLGVVKGVIEPDKACLGGCIINTCQVICLGGTTDPTETPQNKQFFFDNGGCSIKTQPYSQFLQYVPFNSPNTAQGGSSAVAQCCANSLSLCQYVGSTATTNFQQLLAKTAQFCSSFVPSGTVTDICAFFSSPQNCGTTL